VTSEWTGVHKGNTVASWMQTAATVFDRVEMQCLLGGIEGKWTATTRVAVEVSRRRDTEAGWEGRKKKKEEGTGQVGRPLMVGRWRVEQEMVGWDKVLGTSVA